MNIAQRMTREDERRRQLVDAMLELASTDPCGWGVRVDVGPGLFDFAVRLDHCVPQGCCEWHQHE